MPYFAYGSNLSTADLIAWCKRQRRYYPLGASMGRAWLPDHQLVFDTYSGTRRGGVANVIPRKGYAVPGVVFRLRKGGWHTLDIKEGAPFLYTQQDATALLEQAPAKVTPVPCKTYLLDPSDTFIAPAAKYLKAIQNGYAEHQLPFEQLNLAGGDKDAPLPVFVYGTLKRHGRLHKYMQDCDFLGEAEVSGTLLNCGSFPGRVHGKDDATVHGELYRVKNRRAVESVMEALDSIEGFRGFGHTNLYERRIAMATNPKGETIPCWIYHWMGTTDLPVIQDGVWHN